MCSSVPKPLKMLTRESGCGERARSVSGITLTMTTANDQITLSFSAANITDQGVHRWSGEAQTYETGRESQHFVNGRIFNIGMRVKF